MKNKEHIGIIGATGFVGYTLMNRLLKQDREGPSVSVLTRNINNPLLQNLKQERSANIEIKQADHLDVLAVRNTLEKATQIFDTAGLAWQHPGEKELNKHDLMIEEIIQNAISAYVLTQATRPDQVVVWTSTNAIDYMLARLSKEDLVKLRKEVAIITDKICNVINLEDTHFSQFHSIVGSVLAKHQPGWYPKMVDSLEKVQYALDFSYAYSKYLGQTILDRLSQGNIRILKISDIYGPGQDISERMIDPKVPARRLQRFMTAYRLIREGITNWIPFDGSNMHGFSQTDDKITQEVWNDFVFPTHVDDVCEMMIRSARADNFPKTVLEVSGHRITNPKMAATVRDAFGVDVDIKIQSGKTINVPEASEDLRLLGMDRQDLISLEAGITYWITAL